MALLVTMHVPFRCQRPAMAISSDDEREILAFAARRPCPRRRRTNAGNSAAAGSAQMR